MRSFWLVAKHEYRRMVFRRSFLVLTLAVPVGIVVLIGLIILVESMGQNDLPVGYVDHSGLLVEARQVALPDAKDRIPIRMYPDEASARAALENEDIQAFFVLPTDYPRTLQTDLYFLTTPPDGDVWGDFDDFVRLNLVAGYPGQVQDRLFEGPEVTVFDLASRRTFSQDSIVNVILTFVASFFFFIATMMASGYMLQVVADEKENRSMEVMLTSLTPGQLIGGKTFGLLAASLTQLGIYILTIILGLILAAPYIEPLQQVTVPWAYLGVMALFFFPSYGLIAAVMVAIGSAVTDLQQGQQVSGILNLFFMLPLFLLMTIFENPAGRWVVFFSLFPTTAFLTISFRWGLGTVPLWQIGLSWMILVGAMLFMIWAAARIFRVGMLRYGQPLNLKAAVEAVRGG